MSTSNEGASTLTSISVAMFTVSDQDAAVAFYTGKLGFEVRYDAPFGENGEMRWVEVAPPGSTATLSLNPPMGGTPGGSSIAVSSSDVAGEHSRLVGLGDIDVDPNLMETPGAPLMFMVRDPDGNTVVVVEES